MTEHRSRGVFPLCSHSNTTCVWQQQSCAQEAQKQSPFSSSKDHTVGTAQCFKDAFCPQSQQLLAGTPRDPGLRYNAARPLHRAMGTGCTQPRQRAGREDANIFTRKPCEGFLAPGGAFSPLSSHVSLFPSRGCGYSGTSPAQSRDTAKEEGALCPPATSLTPFPPGLSPGSPCQKKNTLKKTTNKQRKKHQDGCGERRG